MAEKRGQLSSLDLLPEEAQDDLVWAIGELNKRRRTQADILFEFNDRLAVKGLGPISKSAFGRASVRMASRASKIEERRRVYASIADKLTPEEVAKNDLVLGEFIKTLIDELSDSEGMTAKGAKDLALAYRAAVSGQKVSLDRLKVAEEAARSKLLKAVDAVEGAIADAAEKPDAAAVLKRIREDVYGIFDR